MADEKDIAAIRFIDSSGGLLRSTVDPDVSCLIPEGALKLQMNFIPVSIQVMNIQKEFVQEFFGQGSAISPVIMIEPVRRKFHKALTVEIPVPKYDDKNNGTKDLKILVSLSGNGDNVRFEDMTGSIDTAERTDNDTLVFTSVCTGRFVLVDCTNSILDVADTMNDLYRKNLHEGYAGLLKAAKAGDVGKLREILRTPGIDINHQNQDGQTALHIACKEGHTCIVEELLKRNADCSMFTKRGNAPIHLACYYGHKDTVQLLLDHAVDVNMPSQGGYPPLYASILENHCELMQLLISRSARSTWISQDGLSLILVAVFSKFNRDKMFSMVELLKDSFNLESQTLSPQLKEKGFKNHGEALLHCLILRTNNLGGKEILEPVRQKLANLSCAQLKEDLDSIELAEEDVTQCLKAVKDNDVEMFEVIIAKGFDINSCTKRSVTALHLACLYGRQKMVEMILDLIKVSDISSVADCLNHTVAVNKQTQGGFTALYLAAQEGYKDIVSLLLDAGASEKVVNNYGLTAQDVAIEMGHKELATLLRDTKLPKHLFESASSTDTNNSPAIDVNKRHSANVEELKKKERRKNTNSCQLS